MQNDVEKHLEYSEHGKYSGSVINTCGWVDGLGYDLIKYAISAIKVDVVLVLDHERLYNDLVEDVCSKSNNVKIEKLNKSGGVVTRDSTYRRQSRMWRIRDYFYGPLQDLTPFTTLVDFADVTIYRIGTGARLSASIIGTDNNKDNPSTKLVEVSIDHSIVQAVLAVSHANTIDSILSSNVAGFLYVMDVNVELKKMNLLAPCPGAMPGKYLLFGSLKWYAENIQ